MAPARWRPARSEHGRQLGLTRATETTERRDRRQPLTTAARVHGFRFPKAEIRSEQPMASVRGWTCRRYWPGQRRRPLAVRKGRWFPAMEAWSIVQ